MRLEAFGGTGQVLFTQHSFTTPPLQGFSSCLSCCAFRLKIQNNISTSLYEIAASLPVVYQMRTKFDLSILCFAFVSKTAAAFKCLQTDLEACLDNLTLLKYILYLSI